MPSNHKYTYYGEWELYVNTSAVHIKEKGHPDQTITYEGVWNNIRWWSFKKKKKLKLKHDELNRAAALWAASGFWRSMTLRAFLIKTFGQPTPLFKEKS